MELAVEVSMAEARPCDSHAEPTSAFLGLGEMQVSSHTFPNNLAVSELSSRLQLRAGLLAG
jgi:hypothetical protein